MKTIKIGMLVMVEWNDAHRSQDWSFTRPKAEPMFCKAVGWITAASGTAIVVSSNMGNVGEPEQAYCLEMTIPRCCIRKIVELKVSK